MGGCQVATAAEEKQSIAEKLLELELQLNETHQAQVHKCAAICAYVCETCVLSQARMRHRYRFDNSRAPG